jgi:hypothetical protein
MFKICIFWQIRPRSADVEIIEPSHVSLEFEASTNDRAGTLAGLEITQQTPNQSVKHSERLFTSTNTHTHNWVTLSRYHNKAPFLRFDYHLAHGETRTEHISRWASQGTEAWKVNKQ